MPRATPLPKQGGMTLIESLIAILIFSIGVLGLAGLQANAVKMSSDAKYRADAAFLADNLIGQLSAAYSPACATSFVVVTGSAPVVTPVIENTNCLAVGAPTSVNTLFTSWLSQVNATLPNAGSANQQVNFNATNNILNITIRWQAPNGTQHSHTVTTQLQWQ